ncbi:MAG: hypothetical protein ACJAVR_000618 [Paracoccaceae bacterium]|jgi:hypothetical protein
MDASQPPQPTRIVIGATSFADARACMGLAVALARRRAAMLVGILAEDLAWAEPLRSPAARLLSVAGDLVPAPSPDALRRLTRADAKNFEHALSRAARRALLRWRFETVAGPMLPRMRAIVATGDPVVLGCPRLHAGRGAVLLIAPHGGAAERLARDLAADLGADLTVILVGAQAFATGAEALAAIGRRNISALVADPEGGPFRTDGDLALLLDQARCPVVLARGAAPGTS